MNGVSEWVTMETLDANPILTWEQNGTGEHTVYYGDKRYIWDKQSTIALRTIGLNQDIIISEFHKTIGCVVCGSHIETHTQDDFLYLCNHCNLLKINY